MDLPEERKRILGDVADGKIDIDEANNLLAILESAKGSTEIPLEYGEVIQVASPDFPATKWKKWWQIPFWISMGVMALAGYWMYTSYLSHSMSWGFWFSFLLFMLSLTGVIASALSRNSKWLHLRVRSTDEGKPKNIAFSIPIPFQFASRVVQMFSWALPEDIRAAHLDEIIQVVDSSISSDQPIEVFVDEEDGDHVEIFIG
jgi:hypothetical protein